MIKNYIEEINKFSFGNWPVIQNLWARKKNSEIKLIKKNKHIDIIVHGKFKK